MGVRHDTTHIMKLPMRTLCKAIGPGILVACAAVGGSHLVWSTRAGAEFGWSLLWLIILTNLPNVVCVCRSAALAKFRLNVP